MNLESRFVSVLIVLANVGAVFYLGVTDYIILHTAVYGTSTISFDYIEPVEGTVIVPFTMAMALVVLLREIRRLTG